MGILFQDLKYGLRMLAKNPGFTAVVVLTLALGIGVNTTIFSVVNQLLLRPPVARDPGELVSIYFSDKNGRYQGLGYPEYVYFRDHNNAFSGLLSYAVPSALAACGIDGRRVMVDVVSGNYFSVLGIGVPLGRGFLPEEDNTPNAHPPAVLSQRFWRSCFASDPNVLGKLFILNGHSFRIIGIASADFRGATLDQSEAEVWVSMMAQPVIKPGLDLIHLRNSGWLSVLGRLKRETTPKQAQADLNLLAAQLQLEFPQKYQQIAVTVVRAEGLPTPFRAPATWFTGFLMVVVGLVLLTACANVSNLLLARTASRNREIAVRMALGASSGRLFRQLLTEAIILALLGGAIGVILTIWTAPLLWGLKPPDIPLLIHPVVDFHVLAFAAGASLLCLLTSGSLPAIRALNPDLVSGLIGQPDRRNFGKGRLRGALVVLQVTICFVLLIGSGLCLSSLHNAETMSPGFESEDGLALSFDPQMNGYSGAQTRMFYTSLLERMENLPGVLSAGLASHLPLGQEHTSTKIFPVGKEGASEIRGVLADDALVDRGYFKTLGVSIVQGRAFSAQDSERAVGVVIVNQTLADRLWPGQDPVGKHVSFSSLRGPTLEVVGVARRGKYRTLGEFPRPFLYLPFAQHYQSAMTLILRTTENPRGLVPLVQDQVRSMDKTLVISNTETVREHLNSALWLARTTATLLIGFGSLALVLAIVGLYGVVSYVVSQRTHEMGIRMALGARREDVLKLVVGQGLKLTLIGVTIGIAGALALTRSLSSLLYGVKPTDPPTFVGVSLILTGVALAACYIPARRATKVDPMVALRCE